MDDGDMVDPQDLDPETVELVKHAVRGFRLTEPDQPYHELNRYHQGEHDAYSSVMGMLTKWLEEIDDGEGESD